MYCFNITQCILFKGESGAGKTEATKNILQFISSICGTSITPLTTTQPPPTTTTIENQILHSNPLLESFGNAKTIRNHNSSRFGKYMEINFDKNYRIEGCNIVSYLLEKSRVVKQGYMERNYHIFYMLLSGLNSKLKSEFHLTSLSPHNFYYLSQSCCFEIENRVDKKEFDNILIAMKSLLIDEVTQYEIFRCLAAILHLGNLLIIQNIKLILILH
jgi:myosin-7